jgi:hypothetical protein
MDLTVYIASNNTATFRCPECGTVKVADVGQYAATDKKITVNCTCVCGHRFKCRLEKRKQYRKGVNFPGKFTLMGENGPEDTGRLNVVDISNTGIKFKLTVPRRFAIGTTLRVEFQLDDRRRTFMRKRVIVRNVSGAFVGASFHPQEMDDRALGFYLMT